MTKHITILIGNQGSGKSTYANSGLFDVVISQDEQGKAGHYEAYLKALDNPEINTICVDRINHTKEQRLRYVIPAKKLGYTVTYKIFSCDYKTALDRITSRTDHKTIKSGDIKTARRALDMYFNKFEYPSDSEGVDNLIRSSVIYGNIYNIQHYGRTIIVGDIHGCFKELMHLLNKVNYNEKNDLLICCGDLVDRGPNSDMVLEFFTNHPSRISVKGNHDFKFTRWLNSNKVNLTSLEKTIESLGDRVKDDEYINTMYYKMMDLPHIIQLNNNNFITHAGFHPFKSPLNTSKEFCYFARHFDKDLNSFTKDTSMPIWYDLKINTNDNHKFFFGHIVHNEFKIINQCYPLDGGACFGLKLRCAILENDNVEIVEVDSSQPKTDGDMMSDYINKFEPYEQLVNQKYLRKQESGSLVLFNYTEACTYEKHWNSYTMESRGIIFNKDTGETVARCFPKFFNIEELENKSLPQMPKNESYEVYEKMDGSMGTLYLDPSDNKYKFATRGSFNSDQAKIATEMWYDTNPGVDVNADCLWNRLLNVKPEYKDFTLLFEIIYPENRVNDGARLVCDYGSQRTLVLLAGIHKFQLGLELNYDDLCIIADKIGLPVVRKYDYTIEQLIEMKKTLPMQEEGWVVKFKSGFRIKLKGLEYCKFQKIINSISPLSIWEKMLDNETFRLSDDYKKLLPEEILPDVNEIERKLRLNYNSHLTGLVDTYSYMLKKAKREYPEKIEKGLGIQLTGSVYDKGIFPFHKEDFQAVKRYVANSIRPTGNDL